jgi:hypothetical protein
MKLILPLIRLSIEESSFISIQEHYIIDVTIKKQREYKSLKYR